MITKRQMKQKISNEHIKTQSYLEECVIMIVIRKEAEIALSGLILSKIRRNVN
jgi:hypothetical protein